MKSFSYLMTVTLILIASFTIGCQESVPETLYTGDYDQAEMDAAIQEARSSVDLFIKALESGDGSDFAVKEPITDGSETEHFWLTDVSYADGKFTGLIGDDPGIVKSVKFGDRRVVDRSDISDWLYMKEGKMQGNYTMRVLLKSAPPEERAKYEALLGE